jgi:hypothetical protein
MYGPLPDSFVVTNKSQHQTSGPHIAPISMVSRPVVEMLSTNAAVMICAHRRAIETSSPTTFRPLSSSPALLQIIRCLEDLTDRGTHNWSPLFRQTTFLFDLWFPCLARSFPAMNLRFVWSSVTRASQRLFRVAFAFLCCFLPTCEMLNQGWSFRLASIEVLVSVPGVAVKLWGRGCVGAWVHGW